MPVSERIDGLVERLTAELAAVSAAIGSVRFMDPPDGGSVTLAEQVARMREALAASERERDEAREMHRKWVEAPEGLNWYIARLKAAEARLAASEAAVEALRGLLMEARNGMDEHFASTDDGVDLNCRIDAALSHTEDSDAGK